jgi:prepilin-type N-terminal cleavage/methylation domain-containing protein
MKTRDGGFSLIEVMVALFIIAIATLIFGYFMTPLRLSKEAQQETRQMALGRNYLDNLRNFWQDPSADCRYIKLLLPSMGTPADPFPKFRLIVTNPTTNAVILDYTSTDTLPNLKDTTLLRNVQFQLLDSSGGATTSLSTQIARITPAPEKCPN